MAVFTPVDDAPLDALTRRLGLGPLVAKRGIEAGVENTNYFVQTEGGNWVLTLFERMTPADLDYCLALLVLAAERGLPVPAPRADVGGRLLHRLSGKPCVLVPRLPGHHVMQPAAVHRQAVGALLARLHLASVDLPLRQPNPRGAAWRADIGRQLAPRLDAPTRHRLAAALAGDAALSATALPGGPVHADAFRDNVLFVDDPAGGPPRLSGLIDFYFAGDDAWTFDLAVTMNDWCLDDTGQHFDLARAQELLAGYAAVRPLQAVERSALAAQLRRAALRFWLSRLADLLLPRDAALLAPKDPAHFERLLAQHEASPWPRRS